MSKVQNYKNVNKFKPTRARINHLYFLNLFMFKKGKK